MPRLFKETLDHHGCKNWPYPGHQPYHRSDIKEGWPRVLDPVIQASKAQTIQTKKNQTLNLMRDENFTRITLRKWTHNSYLAWLEESQKRFIYTKYHLRRRKNKNHGLAEINLCRGFHKARVQKSRRFGGRGRGAQGAPTNNKLFIGIGPDE